MFLETIQARILQLFNKPYLDGTKIPFQEINNPQIIKRIGQWIAFCARKPFSGKWFLAYLIVYILIFTFLYLSKGAKHISWKVLLWVIIFNVFLLVLFENFTIRNGYWGYPDVILMYIYQLPFLGEIKWFVKYFGAVPISNPSFVYPLAYIASVWIFGTFINYSWKNSGFKGLDINREPIELDKSLWFLILKNPIFFIALILNLVTLIFFIKDIYGFRSEIGYAVILALMTLLWIQFLGIEFEMRKRYYGFVEKKYYKIYIKTNMITAMIGLVVESVGLYIFLVWIINPEKTLVYYLFTHTHLEIFNKIYKVMRLSSLEEYYYYIICALLGITTYNLFYFLKNKRDLLHEWIK